MRRKLHKNKKNFFVLFISSIFIFLIFFLLFIKLNFLKIKKLEVLSQNLDCVNKDQIKEVANLYGKSFFNLDTDTVAKQIKEKFYCVKNISFSKRIPNTVKIDVLGRQPIAQIRKLDGIEASSSALFEIFATPSAIQSENRYLLDDEGVVFAKTDVTSNLPAIFVNNLNISLGKKVLGSNTENTLKILEKIKVFGLDISKSIVSSNYLYLFSDPRVIFKLEGDVEAQIASLQLILEKSKIDASKVEFIDLRFDKPIIKIAPKKNG